MKYAGIGSRQTPSSILTIMANIGKAFYDHGDILRSGGAQGADSAFASAVPVDGKTIFRPEHATPLSYEQAAEFHPAWDRCNDYARALHARNSLILFGQDMNDPVDFVVCWTPGAQVTGGTGQALRIASAKDIPVFNLADARHLKALRIFYKSLGINDAVTEEIADHRDLVNSILN